MGSLKLLSIAIGVCLATASIAPAQYPPTKAEQAAKMRAKRYAAEQLRANIATRRATAARMLKEIEAQNPGIENPLHAAGGQTRDRFDGESDAAYADRMKVMDENARVVANYREGKRLLRQLDEALRPPKPPAKKLATKK